MSKPLSWLYVLRKSNNFFKNFADTTQKSYQMIILWRWQNLSQLGIWNNLRKLPGIKKKTNLRARNKNVRAQVFSKYYDLNDLDRSNPRVHFGAKDILSNKLMNWLLIPYVMEMLTIFALYCMKFSSPILEILLHSKIV